MYTPIFQQLYNEHLNNELQKMASYYPANYSYGMGYNYGMPYGYGMNKFASAGAAAAQEAGRLAKLWGALKGGLGEMWYGMKAPFKYATTPSDYAFYFKEAPNWLYRTGMIASPLAALGGVGGLGYLGYNYLNS